MPRLPTEDQLQVPLSGKHLAAEHLMDSHQKREREASTLYAHCVYSMFLLKKHQNVTSFCVADKISADTTLGYRSICLWKTALRHPDLFKIKTSHGDAAIAAEWQSKWTSTCTLWRKNRSSRSWCGLLKAGKPRLLVWKIDMGRIKALTGSPSHRWISSLDGRFSGTSRTTPSFE